ncbi:EAL domain-containing protein [Metabacillus niabensis]|uniref:EAL domain-containing protein n=1 Tax=Metabacillus niabensis TaxID=324854 RepID=UPI0039A00C72
MKLKTKSLLVVGFVMVLFLALLLTTIRPVVLEDAIKLDENEIQKELDTIYNQLLANMDMIKRTNLDWSVWDDTYLFIKDKYPKYPEVNLQKHTFENTILNYMIFLDDKNQLVHQVGYDLANKRFLKLDQDFYKEFLTIAKANNNRKTHLITTEYGLTITSSEPVYPSSGKGDSVGTLIVGKIIDEKVIEELGKSLSIQLSLKKVKNPNNLRTKVETISDKNIRGSLFLKDYSQNVEYELTFVERRSHYLQKKSVVNQLTIYLLFTSLITILLILFLLNRFIVSRIGKLSLQLNQIQENKEVTSRVTVSKVHKDELSKLENTINRMLASLEEKHNDVIKLAYYDQLTMLPNRYYLYDEFTNSIGDEHSKLAVLFMDLDGFKRVNDSLGHEIGDKLLISITDRVSRLIKERNGLISRIGGDEFVILVRFAQIEDLRLLVTNIINKVGEENHFSSLKTSVTASIGVSIYQQDGITLEELLQKADISMYEAKRKGKNQFLFYEELTVDSDYREILELENDLKFALQKNQLELHYQPIICSINHNVVGVEALIRWNHPTKGIISPNLFISVAEEIGLMPKIGEWVLIEAIQQISSLHRKGFNHLVLSINVSKTQMKNHHFIHKIDEVLAKYNFPPSMLQIEITESDISAYLKDILVFLRELKKRNIIIALDDFGVGTSSLLFLKELPIDVIKIDQNFIKNVPKEEFDTILLSGIFKVIKALNKDIVVEGIEKEEQLIYITSQNRTKIQGFYFSRPLPFTVLENKFFNI